MYVHPSPPAGPSASLLGAFWYQERSAHVPGQGLVEYALILVLIAIVTIGTLTLLGKQTSEVFAEVNCRLGGGTMHVDQGQGNSNRCDGGSPGNGGGNGGGNGNGQGNGN